MNLQRSSSAAILSGVFLVALASPAAAHPFTGDDATGAQIAITVVGAVITLAGVAGALLSTGESNRFKADPAKVRKGALGLAVAGFLVFLIGPDLVGPALTPCVRPESEARIAIVGPTQNQVVPSTEVPLEIDLQGGTIADLSSTENREGEGHLHVSIDGRLESMTGGDEQILQIPPGEHLLEVEYVANDHAPFCTRVADRVRFTVDEDAARNTPAEPEDAAVAPDSVIQD